MGAVATQVTGITDLLETDEAKVLIETAERAGSLSAEEIAVAFDELEVDAGTVDDFYRALEELHIDVVGRAATPTRTSSRPPRCARSRPTRCSSSSRTSARSSC